MVTRSKGQGVRDNEGAGIYMYTPLYWEWITNKDFLYSTGNTAQYYVPT